MLHLHTGRIVCRLYHNHVFWNSILLGLSDLVYRPSAHRSHKMVVDYKESKLSSYGLQFRNWPGPGEEAADQFGLSHAVIVPAGSDRIIVGGQVGLKADGSVPSELKDEISEALEHVERALKAAGLGADAWEHVYQVNLYS